jgi:hypothetical protein
VTVTPTTANGREIIDTCPVEASDPSVVVLLAHTPSVTIANAVYLGNEALPAGAVGSVKDQYGAAVTYCFKVTNTGNSFLDTVLIANDALAFSNNTIGRLAPGASATISVLVKSGPISPIWRS